MTEATHIAYVTADGLLEPIGYSQVFRVCAGLARRGYRVTIVSSEWPERATGAAVEALRADAARAGVSWEHDVRVGGRGAIPYARRTARLVRILRRVHARNPIDVNIVRGFPVGPVGVALAASGVPYIYDNRGFWVDQRLAHGTLSRAHQRSARAVEAGYYRAASACISLTEIGAAAVRSGRFGIWSASKPSVCVPTCVDFDAFSLEPHAVSDPVPTDSRRRLEGKLVVAFIGSMNKDYLIDASFDLARRVLSRRPDAMFLLLSSQQAGLGAVAERLGIDPSRMVRATASQRDMPAWLSLVTWGLLLLDTRPDKGGSMPTKLGELLASGVRPVHTGCNAEVGEWVRRAGSGISLADASDRALDEAADRIALGEWKDEDLVRARRVAEPHFSLERGVDRYSAVVDEVVGRASERDSNAEKEGAAMHSSESSVARAGAPSVKTDPTASAALDLVRSRLPELAEQWLASKPFHYLVVDDFLPREWAERLYSTYPSVEDPGWSVRTFVHQAKKYEMRTGMPADLQTFFDTVESEAFLQLLSELTGVPKLLSDPERVGGGLHQIDRGGFLDVHVDYNLHPRTKLHRRLNLLLYMNKQWQPAYNGYLELWNMTDRQKLADIEPRFNRAVLFETTEQSFHGHPVPLETPQGLTRKSLAVYYYTVERDYVAPEHNTLYKQTTGTRGYLKTLASTAQAINENVAANGLWTTVRSIEKRLVRKLRGLPPENR